MFFNKAMEMLPAAGETAATGRAAAEAATGKAAPTTSSTEAAGQNNDSR